VNIAEPGAIFPGRIKSLVSSDPGNTGFNFHRAATSNPPKKSAGNNNSVPRFITSDVQKNAL
jgi:hypothetical protein